MQRIIRIACSPQAEWPRVAAAAVMHALALATIPALAAGAPGAAWRAYAASAAGLALKLAAYGATPLWPAYALATLPVLELVPLIGLVHALYLVDGGAPALLGVKRDDSVQFIVVAMAIAGLGLWAIAAAAGAAGLL